MADFQQNFLASLGAGYNFGQQIKQQQDTSKLNQLASQAYGAAPEQRDSILSQTAAVDAGAAGQLERQMGYSDERRNASMMNMARLLTGAPEQARPGLYRSMVPTLAKFGMSELPQDYNAQTAPIIDKAAQSIMSALNGGKVNNPYDGLPADIQSLRMLQENPELATLDRERRQASGMVPKLVETSGGYGWGTPGGGIQLAPLEGVAGQGGAAQPQTQAPQLFAALGQKYGIRPTSVQRTPERNKQVGGVANSYHLTGQAADWAVPQQFKTQFMADARANGFEAIDEGDHIHIEPATRGGSGGGIAQPYQTPGEQQRLALAQASDARAQQQLGLAERAADRADRAEQRQVSANAITGKPPTEGERKAATLLRRLSFSQQQLADAVGEDPSAASPGLAQSGVRAVLGDSAANAVTPAARQRVEAAQLDILDAALTLGTGAAYTREQLEGYRRSYFPQIGDSKATIDDKAARLQNVIESAKIAAGRAGPQAQQAAPAAPVDDARRALLDKY